MLRKSEIFSTIIILIVLCIQTKCCLGKLEKSLKNELLSSTLDIKINVEESASFDVYFKNNLTQNIEIELVCESAPCSTFDSEWKTLNFTPEINSFTVNFTAKRAGHDVIIFNIKTNLSDPDAINTEWAFVRVRVGRGKFWTVLSVIFGWGYFFFWSASFWPQNFTNCRRKSVVGLNFDYTLLHFSGFLYYSIFNIGLYFFDTIRDEYEVVNPRSEIPVNINDVAYSLHALFTTSITWIQCFIYEKGDQKLALYSKLYQIITWSVGGVLGVLACFHVITWLTFINYFSYIKLSVTSIKYFPQMWFNFKRKSTAGWTIYMVILDIMGGSLSMLEMITNAFNYNDWRILIGNLPKFGLGLASCTYDLIFFVQHYVLYPKSKQQPPKQSA